MFTQIPEIESIPFTRNNSTDFFHDGRSVKSPIFFLKRTLKNVPVQTFDFVAAYMYKHVYFNELVCATAISTNNSWAGLYLSYCHRSS